MITVGVQYRTRLLVNVSHKLRPPIELLIAVLTLRKTILRTNPKCISSAIFDGGVSFLSPSWIRVLLSLMHIESMKGGE